jgi:hypothetical protein
MLFYHANRSALLVRGLVFFILGLIGLFRPIGSLAAVTVILGIFLLVDAMGALFLSFACRRFSGVFWSLLLCAAGIAMMVRPVEADVLIAVVLGEENADSAYHDVVKIFEYGFQNAQTVTITAAEIGTKTVEVMDGGKHVADVVFSADSGFSILLPKDVDPSGLKAEIVVANESSSSPERISAEVRFTLNGEPIGSAPMEKKIIEVRPEAGVIEKTGGFRQIFDYACIVVLALVLLLPPLVKFLTSLEPPE